MLLSPLFQSLETWLLQVCNSLFFYLALSQHGRHQFILNSTARAVSESPKYCHITLVLKYLLHHLQHFSICKTSPVQLTFTMFIPTVHLAFLNMQRLSVHSRIKSTERQVSDLLCFSNLEQSTQISSPVTRRFAECQLACSLSIHRMPNHRLAAPIPFVSSYPIRRIDNRRIVRTLLRQPPPHQ